MKNYKQIFANLLNDESGQDLVEYALVVAMVAGIALAASTNLGGIISSAITSVGAKITSAIAG